MNTAAVTPHMHCRFLETFVRFAGPLSYAAAVPALYGIHPQAPLLLVALLPLVLIIADILPVPPAPSADSGLAKRIAVWLTAIAYLALILWGCAVAAVNGRDIVVLALVIGVGAGVFAMMAAHELIHSRSRAEKALGLLMLTAMTYRHFRVSHLRGHHRWAATARDFSTARRGESAYAFLGRAVRGQISEIFRQERGRLARHAPLSWRNRLLQDAALYAAFLGALALALGSWAAALQVLQSAVAIIVLELFNYVAHYGLLRQAGPGGQPEPLSDHHSWNAAGEVGNWLLLDMGRHAAHHARNADAAALRTLPGGYAGAVMLALVPPLWRKVMDARIEGRDAAAVSLPSMVQAAAVCVAGLMLVGCGAARLPPVETSQGAPDGNAVQRGAYLVAAGNCIGCHTDKKTYGQPFAGGAPVLTKYGTYYSHNITPDRTHGIGAWSDQAFLRALRDGISPSGDYYFPAFPFPSFTNMTDRDILDIKAYLMTQKPSAAANKKHDVPFPYGFRPSMAAWRLLYFKKGPLKPDPGRSAEWNRGNYLVNAVSHCGECHTPRNGLGATEKKRAFSGGKLDTPGGVVIPNYTTRVPNITPHPADGIGKWSVDNIVNLLKVGQVPDGDFVAAPMSEVVEGTSKLNDADRRAIAVYLKSLPPLPGKGG